MKYDALILVNDNERKAKKKLEDKKLKNKIKRVLKKIGVM